MPSCGIADRKQKAADQNSIVRTQDTHRNAERDEALPAPAPKESRRHAVHPFTRRGRDGPGRPGARHAASGTAILLDLTAYVRIL